MNLPEPSMLPGRGRSTGSPYGSLRLPLAALAFLSLGGFGACGGSEAVETTGPPPPPPPPPEPSVSCTESSAEATEGPWQVQASGVEGVINRIQFLDAAIGRAVRMNRGGPLTLLRTSDGGATWCRIQISADRTRDMGHFFVFLDPDTGFTGGQECTILMTEDGGLTWTDRRFCDPTHWFLAIAPIDSERIWIGREGLLFRSRDGGDSWEEVTVAGLDGAVMGFAFFSREVGVLVESLRGDVFRTADRGGTWERHRSPGGEGQLLFDVALANATTAIAVGRAGTIVRTTDRGATWLTVESGVSATLWGVDFGADGFGVAVGDGGRILVSTDAGATWTAEESPVQTQLSGVSVLDTEHAWVSGQEGTILVRRAE